MPNTTHPAPSAYDVLTHASERELADLFFAHGEERCARRIAHTIVERRAAGTLPHTTTEFAALIAGVIHTPTPAPTLTQCVTTIWQRLLGRIRPKHSTKEMTAE